MANLNVFLPLGILLICALVVWFTHGVHQRREAARAEERMRRRNAGRPLPRSAQPPSLPGSTQSVPAVTVRPGPPPLPNTAPPLPNTAPPLPNTAPPLPPLPETAYQPPHPSHNGAGYPAVAGYESATSPESIPAWQPVDQGPTMGGNAFAPREDESRFNGHSSDPPALDRSFATPSTDPSAVSPHGNYASPSEDLEMWLEIYANDVESWVLNHERILDEVTVKHLPLTAVTPELLATRDRLEDRLDHGAQTHPSRQQGAELLELLNAADETLEATRSADYERAETSHGRYLSYRDIWLPRVQRSLQH